MMPLEMYVPRGAYRSSSSFMMPLEISSTVIASKVRIAVLRRCDIFLASAESKPFGIDDKYFCTQFIVHT